MFIANTGLLSRLQYFHYVWRVNFLWRSRAKYRGTIIFYHNKLLHGFIIFAILRVHHLQTTLSTGRHLCSTDLYRDSADDLEDRLANLLYLSVVYSLSSSLEMTCLSFPYLLNGLSLFSFTHPSFLACSPQQSDFFCVSFICFSKRDALVVFMLPSKIFSVYILDTGVSLRVATILSNFDFLNFDMTKVVAVFFRLMLIAST